MKTIEAEPAADAVEHQVATTASDIKVALLTGGSDRPYAFGLSMALVSKGIGLDFLGSDHLDGPEMHATEGLDFVNLHRDSWEKVGPIRKYTRVLAFYARLLWYAINAKPKIFHILWNNKLKHVDRTLMMFCYKILGKKVAFTAHNVNQARRDGRDSPLNRLTLRIQYRLADHIFVHTEKMKTELLDEFGVRNGAVTRIPFGINNAVPHTSLTAAEARKRLGLESSAKTILFFGAIWPYKGLEHLVAAFQRIAASRPEFRLVIAGESKKGSEQYLRSIQECIASEPTRSQIIQKIEFVPDNETEVYFKAADVLALPYTEVFQSGVLFLAYSFGLPVIASQVGSFRDDVIEGRTGLLCRTADPEDLGRVIETYFASELFQTLDRKRQEIRDYATARNSWSEVADITTKIYQKLLGTNRP